MFSTKKRIAAVALSGAVILGAGGIAAAYFTSTGNGTGSGTVGTATNFAVSSTTANGPLYPGAATTDQTVTVKIKNVGTGNQELNSFTISVANSDGSPWASATPFATEGACTQADFALGGQPAAGSYTVSGIADDLLPGATHTATVNLHMLDTGVPQDNCQGVSTPLYISAS
jgi:hypothetical protein